MRSANPRDPNALPVIRGEARTLEPEFDVLSERDMHRGRSRLPREKRPICVSLWSGAGGLDLGLERAGFYVAVAPDFDDWACQTHAYNSRAAVFRQDLSTPEKTREFLESLDLPHVDLLAGGFPCQPFSRAGRSI